MKAAVESIKELLTLSSVISKRVELKQRGVGEYIGLCPFHKENTPSFTVSDSKGFYHCFGCGKHGDIIDFIIDLEGSNYIAVVQTLAAQAGVELPKKNQIEDRALKVTEQIFKEASKIYKANLFQSTNALSYLKSRGISEEVITKYNLGFASGNIFRELLKNFNNKDIVDSGLLKNGRDILFGRIIFPIHSISGNVVAFGGRVLDDSNKRMPKYLNSAENLLFKKGNELYGLHYAKETARKSNELIIVEGYMDVLVAASQGMHNVVASLGTSLSIAQINRAWKIVSYPTIFLDMDNAGRAATLRIALIALQHLKPGFGICFANTNHIKSSIKDPGEIIEKFGIKVFKHTVANAFSLADWIFDKKVNEIGFLAHNPDKIAKLRSSLDEIAQSALDYNIRTEYKNYFRDKIFHLTRKKGRSSALNAQNKIAFKAGNSDLIETQRQEHYYIFLAIYCAVYFPYILLEEENRDLFSSIKSNNESIVKVVDFLLSYNIDQYNCSIMNLPEDFSAISKEILSVSLVYERILDKQKAQDIFRKSIGLHKLQYIRYCINKSAEDLKRKGDIADMKKLHALKQEEFSIRCKFDIA